MIDKISQDLINSIVEALYASDKIIIVGDGCSTRTRDKIILQKIIEQGIRFYQDSSSTDGDDNQYKVWQEQYGTTK